MLQLVFLAIVLFMLTSDAMKCRNSGEFVSMPVMDLKQFSYRVQISKADSNETLQGFEFYDDENTQTIAVNVHHAVGSNSTPYLTELTYDYEYRQLFIVNEYIESRKVCTVKDLKSTMPKRASLFGVGIENGPHNVKHAFYWNGTYNITYQGNNTIIDGIRTNHYQTCLSFDGGKWTYLLDLYFSSENWNMPFGQQAPVLLTLTAEDYMNVTHVYTYNFFDFQNSVSYSAFRSKRPSDIVCLGRKDAPIFDVFPQQFHYQSEFKTTGPNYSQVLLMTEYYDFTKKLLKVDLSTITPTNESFIEMHVFEQGLSYLIDKATLKCSVNPIPVMESFYDAAPSITNPRLVRMRNPKYFNDIFNLTYGGLTEYMGKPAHVWLPTQPAKIPDEIFHGETAWIYESYYVSAEKRNGRHVLLGIKDRHESVMNSTHNITSHIEGQVYNFGYGVNVDVFDISPCFSSEEQEKVILKFHPKYKQVVIANKLAFKEAFLASAAKHTNISQLRMNLAAESFYEVAPYGASNFEHMKAGIFIWLTLFDVAPVKGDSIYMKHANNLSVALASLRNAVETNQFKVTFTTSQRKQTSMTAFSNYWMTERDLLYPGFAGVSLPIVIVVGCVGPIFGFFLGCISQPMLATWARGRRGYTSLRN